MKVASLMMINHRLLCNVAMKVCDDQQKHKPTGSAVQHITPPDFTTVNTIKLVKKTVWQECYVWPCFFDIKSLRDNVKNIYRRRHMSRVRIGGAGGRRNVMSYAAGKVLFSDVPCFRRCGQRVPDSRCSDTESLG